MASSPSQGKVEILNYKSAEGVFLVLSGAPSFSYSEAQSLNGKNGNETEPPAFVPRNLLLEAKREIRVLQERCRELENGVNTLRGQNEKLKEDNNKFLQQFGEFEGQVVAAVEERETLAAEVKSTKRAQDDLKLEIESARQRQNQLMDELKSPRSTGCLSPQALEHRPRTSQIYSSVACGIALLAVPIAAVAAFRSRAA